MLYLSSLANWLLLVVAKLGEGGGQTQTGPEIGSGILPTCRNRPGNMRKRLLAGFPEIFMLQQLAQLQIATEIEQFQDKSWVPLPNPQLDLLCISLMVYKGFPWVEDFGRGTQDLSWNCSISVAIWSCASCYSILNNPGNPARRRFRVFPERFRHVGRLPEPILSKLDRPV